MSEKATCANCSAEFEMSRKQRRTQAIRRFCSRDCHMALLKNESYVRVHHASRNARRRCRKFFPLQKGQVVLHVDGNTANNERENLVVFASQGDHLRWHRIGEWSSIPIWAGDENLNLEIEKMRGEFAAGETGR